MTPRTKPLAADGEASPKKEVFKHTQHALSAKGVTVAALYHGESPLGAAIVSAQIVAGAGGSATAVLLVFTHFGFISEWTKWHYMCPWLYSACFASYWAISEVNRYSPRASYVLCLLNFLPPYLFPLDLPVIRFLVASSSMHSLGRMIMLSNERSMDKMSMFDRGIFIMCYSDVRTCRFLSKWSPLHLIKHLILSAVFAAGTVLIAVSAIALAVYASSPYSASLPFVVRYAMAMAGGAIAAVEGVLLLDWMYVLMFAFMGVVPSPSKDMPFRAKSMQELWGKRWNLVTNGMLRYFFFDPLVKRGYGVALGGLVSFTASGACMHAYQTLVAGLGLRVFICTTGFFVMQWFIVSLEVRAVPIRRFPVWLRHVWVWSWIAISAPLAAEPYLRLMLHMTIESMGEGWHVPFVLLA